MIAIAVVVGIVWWVRSRGDASPSDGTTAPTAPSAGARAGSGSAQAAPGRSPDGGRVVPVQIVPANRTDLDIWLDGLGSVAAFQQVTVHTLVDGRLDKVLFTEGQTVKAGEVIAQIDPRPFLVQLHNAQGALARDRANRDAAKKAFDRDTELHKQNLIAQAQVDTDAGTLGQAEGNMLIDQAQIESAQLNLDYAAIKSPCAGITGVRLVDAGNIVHVTDATGIVVITAIDPAAVFFTVPQDSLPQVSAALARGPVKVIAWNRDKTVQLGEGTVAVLDNQINQTTSTLRLKALVGNPKRLLWPNAFVKASMLVETRKNALVVPLVAIQHGPQDPKTGQQTLFVYTVGSDNTAKMVTVTLATTTNDKAVIETGLKGGERVVVDGANQLRPGTRVSIQDGNGERAHHGAPAGGSASGTTASNAPPAASP
ncbi:MAG TPA: efflux RND transporter periplasmic adaptor subunit [Kofleriaceae bacterium]|nr:efflux RND transporter periplasmic adaptor subunit [Kofleriaceae bacterium]